MWPPGVPPLGSQMRSPMLGSQVRSPMLFCERFVLLESLRLSLYLKCSEVSWWCTFKMHCPGHLQSLSNLKSHLVRPRAFFELFLWDFLPLYYLYLFGFTHSLLTPNCLIFSSNFSSIFLSSNFLESPLTLFWLSYFLILEIFFLSFPYRSPFLFYWSKNSIFF